MNEQEYKEIVQNMYREYRQMCGRSTAECMDFLKWIHEAHNDLKYLEDMTDLTLFERNYISYLLND